MSAASFQTLGSIEAVRPVFLIVMGVFMLLIAWRLAKTSGVWTSRLMVVGSLMLAFGYAVIMPLYEAGVLEAYSPLRIHYHGSAANALAWQVVKMVVMNVGWFVFGLGLAMHAGILSSPSPRKQSQTRSRPPHESVA
jgi:hypothetical protein